MQSFAAYIAYACAAALAALVLVAALLPKIVSLIVFGDLGRPLSVTLAAATGAAGLILGFAAGRATRR